MRASPLDLFNLQAKKAQQIGSMDRCISQAVIKQMFNVKN